MPLLYKGWIKLSTAEIAIQWISVNKTNHAIRCIVIYQVDNVIHLLNNPARWVILIVPVFLIREWLARLVFQEYREVMVMR